MGKRHLVKPECGTRSGYDWHRRDAKEDPCNECREAEAAYWRKERVVRGDVIRANNMRRHAKRYRALGLNPKIGRYTETEVLDRYGTVCHICNTEIDMSAPRGTGKPGWEKGLQIDHVIPLSKGGDHTIENVRPSHGHCNLTKSATLVLKGGNR
jgi:5-methylcytosine-specific restriction endonuclease McrA